ncbi:hypothetical protein QQ008_03260 [Fulvivirgaceae bacterium BMA10]|uniref:Tetratricopeptide repeat protein n=1 Tax=Splendidivirga corallicola TaxID=3051826 RepID=A0ABT8KLA7_9BACT|nr:hypothetical protein [Fulvivirgaceae bacterium BMA10]
MKHIRFIILSLFLFCSFLVNGQDNLLQEALTLYKEGKLIEAKAKIDQAAGNEELAGNINTWYLRGFIYKDLYKNHPEEDVTLQYRSESIKAFKRLSTLEGAEKFQSDISKSLKYIATTYYNDAIRSLSNAKFSNSESFYDHYKNAIVLADAQTDLQASEVDYYLSLGSKYMQMHKVDSIGNGVYLQSAEKSYNKVLAIDANNIKANYNIGVLYYNEAVSLISKMDYDEFDLVQFSSIEDRSIELFKKSLPFMETAYRLDPKDRNTIEGLAGIYFSLRDFDKSNEYKAKLEELH